MLPRLPRQHQIPLCRTSSTEKADARIRTADPFITSVETYAENSLQIAFRAVRRGLEPAMNLLLGPAAAEVSARDEPQAPARGTSRAGLAVVKAFGIAGASRIQPALDGYRDRPSGP